MRILRLVRGGFQFGDLCKPSAAAKLEMSRRKRQQGNSTPPTNRSAFRDEERRWKSRVSPPDLSLAFDINNIAWDAEPVDGRLRGVWTSGDGQAEECWRAELHDLAETAMGQSRWKGKDRQEEGDYAIIVPRIPGTSALAMSVRRYTSLTARTCHRIRLFPSDPPRVAAASSHNRNALARGSAESHLTRQSLRSPARRVMGGLARRTRRGNRFAKSCRSSCGSLNVRL